MVKCAASLSADTSSYDQTQGHPIFMYALVIWGITSLVMESGNREVPVGAEEKRGVGGQGG